jgi:PAS domain S-box-containing protein
MLRDRELELRIALHPEPRIVDVGVEIDQVLGYSAAAFRRDPGLWLARTHPDDVPVVRTLIAQPMRFERPVTYRVQHRLGAWVWLEQRHQMDASSVSDDGMITSVIRVVEAASEETGPTSDVFRLRVDGVVEALAILDAEGKVRYESPAVEHVLGYLPGEQVGETAFAFMHPDDIPEVAAAFADIAERPGSQARRRYRHKHKDGSWRLVESVAQNALDNPLIRGIVVHTFAVDERLRLEQQVREVNTALRMLATSRAQLIDELQRTQRRKDELSALLVHDLKSPLNAILLNIEALRESVGVEDLSAVQAIEHATKSLLGMALDLLDISRSEDGELVPQASKVDVRQFVDGIVRGARGAIELDVELTNAVMAFDESLVERVIVNFLDNAFRHTKPGTRPKLIVRDDDHALAVRVCDQGPGIADADKARVFEKYVQLENAKRRRDNRGLGLVFCRLAATAHGGQVWVEDNEPSGSRFCLRLPRVEPT